MLWENDKQGYYQKYDPGTGEFESRTEYAGSDLLSNGTKGAILVTGRVNKDLDVYPNGDNISEAEVVIDLFISNLKLQSIIEVG
jgi:non-ribosomal peptide synthetase component E (peptide arylation enzyme)